ncbi:hypothetical protein [Paenibacillus ehimensis]|uniref:Uncharacterized protein n=2 Tax=Paenibacillus ehimensis TaxID=79264 RepID=A0ABT8V4I6_9BACL|nr:hypothetical protein [Paenibacillus ehimensis]MDO3675663.1 hypothetical protein [Paenibacillus ehimensis]
MSILLRVERESSDQPIELGNGQITGYSYINTSPVDFFAKAYNAVHSIQIRGEIPLRLLPPVEQDADNSNTLYAWALTEYRPDNDYYRSVTVKIIRHEKIIRELVFTHAYVHGYNEQVNGWKGTLEFELILRQKRDQLDSIRCSSGESTIQNLTNKKDKRVSLLAYSGNTPFDNSSQYQSMNVLKEAVLGTLNNTKDWVTEKADQARGINSTLSGMDSGYKMLIGDDINTLLDPNLAPKEKAQELVGIPVFGILNGLGKGVGKAANDLGKIRTQRVADITGGTVTEGPTVKTSLGVTDVDVTGPNGEIIEVGGPAKANDLGKFKTQLLKMQEVANSRGVPAQVYLEEGTPQAAIDIAKKTLGENNVFTFKLD